MIYGKEDAFNIEAEAYFSENKVEIEDVLARGIPEEEYWRYLNQFIQFKKNSGIDDSGGTGGIGKFAMVAGISHDQKNVICMSLEDYCFAQNMELESAPDQSSSNGPR